MTVHEPNAADGAVQSVDVRNDEEWRKGCIPGARHIFLGELRDRLGGLPSGARRLDRSRPHATYCASGFRASMAASILAADGFEDVRNVPGVGKHGRPPAIAAGNRIEGGSNAGLAHFWLAENRANQILRWA